MKEKIVNIHVKNIIKMNEEEVVRTYTLLPKALIVSAVWTVDVKRKLGLFAQTCAEPGAEDTYTAEYNLKNPKEWFEFNNSFFTSWFNTPDVFKSASAGALYEKTMKKVLDCFPINYDGSEEYDESCNDECNCHCENDEVEEINAKSFYEELLREMIFDMEH